MRRLVQLLMKAGLDQDESIAFLNQLYLFIQARMDRPQGLTTSHSAGSLDGESET